jgi:hypothetical protein
MLHTSLTGIEMPERIKRLPVDKRGFPVPKFVAVINGEPDHRVVNPKWFVPAVNSKLCWICGEPMGRYFTSIIGCMCSVNRVISEPPSHRDCAEFSVKACPFLSRPTMHRREAGMPDNKVEAAGFGLKRNPGVACLWISKQYPKPFRAQAGQQGVLFELGNPVETIWYREGRLATRAEVEEAVSEGLPNLLTPATEEGPEAVAALKRMAKAAIQHYPAL